VGLGFDLKVTDHFSSLISWGVPVSEKGLLGELSGSTIFWTLTYDP